MTKKSRRTRSTPRLSASQLVGTEGAPEIEKPLTSPAVVTPRRAVVARPAGVGGAVSREEYGYVLGDLKRIGIIAGLLLAVMAILAVVLPQVMG